MNKEDIINELNKQNIELGEELSLTKDRLNKEKFEKDHYKHLYSELKKQKDDVVEYIKKRTIFGEYTIAYPGILNQDEVRKILRMLGETDE